MIAPMTRDMRLELKKHTAQPQPPPAPVEPVAIPPRKDVETAAPAQRTPKRPAANIEPIAQAKQRARGAKQTYRQMKTSHFMEQHQRFMRKLETESFDVRWLAGSVNRVGFWAVWLTHLYVKGRKFLMAHRAGFCNGETCCRRAATCIKDCDWAYDYKNIAYCKGCNCGRWIGSRRSHQLRLAKFVCPRGKFDEAPGWVARAWGWLRRNRKPKAVTKPADRNGRGKELETWHEQRGLSYARQGLMRG